MTRNIPEMQFPNTRLVQGSHFADIVVNRDGTEPIFYWIVQRVGSADVVGWGTENNFVAAEQEAKKCLADLEQRLANSAGAGQ